MKRAPQQRHFNNINTRHPLIKSSKRPSRDEVGEGSSRPVMKRPRMIVNNPAIIDAFRRSIQRHLTAKITTIIQKVKKVEEGLQKLKNELLVTNKLPPGILQQAAKSLGYLRPSEYTDHLDKAPINRNIEEWKNYVSENFDRIVLDTKNASLARDSQQPQKPTTSTTNITDKGYTIFTNYWLTSKIKFSSYTKKLLANFKNNILKLSTKY